MYIKEKVVFIVVQIHAHFNTRRYILHPLLFPIDANTKSLKNQEIMRKKILH